MTAKSEEKPRSKKRKPRGPYKTKKPPPPHAALITGALAAKAAALSTTIKDEAQAAVQCDNLAALIEVREEITARRRQGMATSDDIRNQLNAIKQITLVQEKLALLEVEDPDDEVWNFQVQGE